MDLRLLDLLRWSILSKYILERNPRLTASWLAVSLWFTSINFDLTFWNISEKKLVKEVFRCFKMFWRLTTSRQAISLWLYSGIFLAKFNHLNRCRTLWPITFTKEIFSHFLTVPFGKKIFFFYLGGFFGHLVSDWLTDWQSDRQSET